MDLFTNHKGWWAVLVSGSLVVSSLRMETKGVVFALSYGFTPLLVSLLIAGIPWLFFRLIKKPLKTAQIMSMVIVGWLIFTLLLRPWA